MPGKTMCIYQLTHRNIAASVSGHQRSLRAHQAGNQSGSSPKSCSSRMLFTKLEYTSSKFSGEIAMIQLRGYCQACSLQFFWYMKHKFQSRECDLLLLVDAIAASHYQHLTLEWKTNGITLYIYTHISHIATTSKKYLHLPHKNHSPNPAPMWM